MSNTFRNNIFFLGLAIGVLFLIGLSSVINAQNQVDNQPTSPIKVDGKSIPPRSYCCLLNHTIKIEDLEVSKGDFVGSLLPVSDSDSKLQYYSNPLGLKQEIETALQEICPEYIKKGQYIKPGEELRYYPRKDWAGYCLLDGVMTITDWIKFFAGIITVLAIIIAGVMFITAGGNPEKAGKAKKMLLYSIIGIAVVVMAHMVPSLIKFFV